MKNLKHFTERRARGIYIRARPGTFSGGWVCLLLSIFLSGLCYLVPVAAAAPVEIAFPASTPYNNKAVTLRAELYRPAGEGPFPAVVLMHGCGGLSPPVQLAMRTHARYFVRHGYVALNVDSFGPRGNGDGWVCKTFDRLMAARRYRRADALDALRYLQSLDFVDDEHIFQVGQSNGGSVAIRLAQLDQPVFRATAAYYPWCGTFNRLGSSARLTSPLIVLTGAMDDWTPPGDCQTVQSSLAEYRVIVYPGAVHSFDLEISRQEYQGHQVGYDARATVDSRRQMLAFFHDQLSDPIRASMPVIEPIEPRTVTYLSGDEIRRLMPSGKLQGINVYGNPYTITYTVDGVIRGIAGKRDEYGDTGKWWVEDERFCRQYQSWMEGQAACFQVSLQGDNIGFHDAAGKLVSTGRFK